MFRSAVRSLYYFTCGVVGVFPVAIVAMDVVGRPSTVTGNSMRPTLNPANLSRRRPHNDVVWLSSRVSLTGFRPGEIVALRSPVDPAHGMLKRVIAVEGEMICTRCYHRRYVVVPKGHLWVEGDNTRSSQDSNFYGPVSAGLVYGKATHILWPLNRIQTLSHTLTKEQRTRRKDGLLHRQKL